MYSGTLIVIPAHNEGGRIGGVIRGIRAAGVRADILVVDDGSEDDTGMEARRHGAIVVTHNFNIGYGSALSTGYHYAQRHSYKRIVQMDADGQHDPASVPALLEALDDGADVAVGSRFLDSNPPPTSFARRVGSRLFSAIASWGSGVEITDSTSGFQAMKACAFHQLAHDGFPEDYPDADVLITLARSGLQLTEVPVVMHARESGVSMHAGGRSAYYAYKMLLTLCLLPWRRQSPFRTAAVKTARAG